MRILISFIAITLLASGSARAADCTLKAMQDNFASIGKLTLKLNSEKSDHMSRGEELSLEREQLRLDLIRKAADIRISFSGEIEKSPNMQPGDLINSDICTRSSALISKYSDLPPPVVTSSTSSKKAPIVVKVKKEEKPKCANRTIRKRFGDASRKQRSLRIAGKITNKEHVNYLGMTTRFTKSLKHDFDKACAILTRYEKKLVAENEDETQKVAQAKPEASPLASAEESKPEAKTESPKAENTEQPAAAATP